MLIEKSLIDLPKPALSIIEISSIARGIFVLDCITKKAPILIIQATPISKGRYLILFGGDEASVEESYKEGLIHTDNYLIDGFIIYNIHEKVYEILFSKKQFPNIITLGVLETSTSTSIVRIADLISKGVEIDLVNIHLAKGIGAKGYLIFTGTQDMVEAGLDIGEEYAKKNNVFIEKTLIPNPHKDILEHLT